MYMMVPVLCQKESIYIYVDTIQYGTVRYYTYTIWYRTVPYIYIYIYTRQVWYRTVLYGTMLILYIR